MEARSDRYTSLRQSQGFLVESAGGRVGVVEDLRYGTGRGIPDFLIVRAGLLGRNRMMISVDDIREVLPHEKRIRLQAMWMTIKT